MFGLKESINVELIDNRKEQRTVVVVKNVPYRVKPPEMVRVLGAFLFPYSLTFC